MHLLKKEEKKEEALSEILLYVRGKLQGCGEGARKRPREGVSVWCGGICRRLAMDYNKISLEIHFVLYKAKFGAV